MRPKKSSRFAASSISRVRVGPKVAWAAIVIAGNLLRRPAAGARNLGRGARGRYRRHARRSARGPRRLLAEQEMMFEAIWRRLTLAQRAVRRSCAGRGARYCRRRAGTAPLGGASASGGARGARRCHRPRRRAIVVDSLLRGWVARHTFRKGPPGPFGGPSAANFERNAVKRIHKYNSHGLFYGFSLAPPD
jgi:hypothetical protein